MPEEKKWIKEGTIRKSRKVRRRVGKGQKAQCLEALSCSYVFSEVCLKLLNFVFYYTWLINTEAASQGKGHLFQLSEDLVFINSSFGLLPQPGSQFALEEYDLGHLLPVLDDLGEN